MKSVLPTAGAVWKEPDAKRSMAPVETSPARGNNSAEHMEQACQHGWGVGLRQGTEV